MEKKLNILILEDLPSDAELTKREVQKVIPESVTKVVDTEKDYVQALRTFNPDMIVSDYMMPTFDGMSALKIRMEKAKNVPFIMLTGSMNEEVAVKCMKAGADDYVIKGHNKRLGQAVLSALEKKKIDIRRQIAESENRKHTDDLTLMNIINKAIIRGDSLPVIIKLLSIETKKYFNCKNTTVYLVSEDNKYLEMQNLYLPDSVAKPLEKIIGSHIPQIRIPLKNGSLSQKYL